MRYTTPFLKRCLKEQREGLWCSEKGEKDENGDLRGPDQILQWNRTGKKIIRPAADGERHSINCKGLKYHERRWGKDSGRDPCFCLRGFYPYKSPCSKHASEEQDRSELLAWGCDNGDRIKIDSAQKNTRLGHLLTFQRSGRMEAQVAAV